MRTEGLLIKYSTDDRAAAVAARLKSDARVKLIEVKGRCLSAEIEVPDDADGEACARIADGVLNDAERSLCKAIEEGVGRCGRGALADGYCATHTQHETFHPGVSGQAAPQANEQPSLWPMVMKGWQASAENLFGYVDALKPEEMLRQLYLTNFVQIAIIARLLGKSAEDVAKDMQARHEFGAKKYGTPLQPFNGRSAMKDAYDELLDGQVYLRQHLFEQGHKED